ncbi:E3 ubiquitin-protein ligase TRIM33-like [Anolis sagrei]|uniref:E3 ubiquitin-protein ligase TRIM33-like n=1 Tax=Anolis sagrei TaxID=38937 RepID=UPI0035209CC6
MLAIDADFPVSRGLNPKRLLVLQEKDEEFQFLRCGGCSSEVSNPKLLPCLHNLCTQCLQETPCALCKSPHPPYKDLPDNFLFSTLQADLKKREEIRERKEWPCSGTKRGTDDPCGTQSELWCPACNEFLCQACYESCPKFVKCKNHKTWKLEDIGSKTRKEFLLENQKRMTSCPKGEHKKNIARLTCDECPQFLCKDCMSKTNRKHSEKHCDDEEIQEKRKELKESTAKKKKSYDDTKAILVEMIKKKKSSCETAKAEIRDRVEKMVKKLRKKEEEFLADIEKQYEQEVQDEKGMLQETNNALEKVSSCEAMINALEFCFYNQYFMDMHPTIEGFLKDCKEMQPPVVDPQVHVENFVEIRNQCRAWCDEVTRTIDVHSGKVSAKRKHIGEEGSPLKVARREGMAEPLSPASSHSQEEGRTHPRSEGSHLATEKPPGPGEGVTSDQRGESPSSASSHAAYLCDRITVYERTRSLRSSGEALLAIPPASQGTERGSSPLLPSPTGSWQPGRPSAVLNLPIKKRHFHITLGRLPSPAISSRAECNPSRPSSAQLDFHPEEVHAAGNPSREPPLSAQGSHAEDLEDVQEHGGSALALHSQSFQSQGSSPILMELEHPTSQDDSQKTLQNFRKQLDTLIEKVRNVRTSIEKKEKIFKQVMSNVVSPEKDVMALGHDERTRLSPSVQGFPDQAGTPPPWADRGALARGRQWPGRGARGGRRRRRGLWLGSPPGLNAVDAQVSAVTRRTFALLKLVRPLQLHLMKSELASVVHALVTSRLDYCNVLYVGLPLKTAQKLQLFPAPPTTPPPHPSAEVSLKHLCAPLSLLEPGRPRGSDHGVAPACEDADPDIVPDDGPSTSSAAGVPSALAEDQPAPGHQEKNARSPGEASHTTFNRTQEIHVQQETVVFFDLKLLSQHVIHLVAKAEETRTFSVTILPRDKGKNGLYDIGLDPFLDYLQSLHRPILVGFKIWSMGLLVLAKDLKILKKEDRFEASIAGFLDVLPLLKDKITILDRDTLTDLDHKYLDGQFRSTEPSGGAKILEKLCAVWEINPLVIKNAVVPYSILQFSRPSNSS